MLKIFGAFLFAALSFCALNSSALEGLKLESGRYVAVENNVQDPDAPAFIFLPGINRGLDRRDEFIQLATAQNLNFVSMHFSLQIESILKVPANEIPYSRYNNYTSEDLANEVLAVIQKYKLTQPIVVGLSYSAVVTSKLATLGQFPLIVDTAPMIRFDETDSSGAAQINEFWKNYFALYPIYGDAWKQIYLQQVYEKYWSNQIDGLLEGSPRYQKPEDRADFITSYAKLSVISDGFDYDTQDFKKGPTHLFILGEQEEPARMQLQLKMISRYEKETKATGTTAILKNAGHIVPSDTPASYLKALKQVLKKYKALK